MRPFTLLYHPDSDASPGQTPRTPRELVAQTGLRVLLTAGPTHEPIDAVRFIGNRSSGKMGVALAEDAACRGWDVHLLMGPSAALPKRPDVKVTRFRTCEDLRSLLSEHVPAADVLIMAAAVADYRPKVDPSFFGGKFRRKNEPLMLELEPTPDLLAEVGESRRPDQLFVGFALEPRAEMCAAALAKMQRKKIDMVVANPLETMDSDSIEATVMYADGRDSAVSPKGLKSVVAPWLNGLVQDAWQRRKQAASLHVEHKAAGPSSQATPASQRSA